MRSGWLIKKIIRTYRLHSSERDADYRLNRLQSIIVLESAVQAQSNKLGFHAKSVVIRNQKRRWGSCSNRGTISLNYRVALLPPCLRDYVIIHELCHLKEMNHGPRFWALVALHCPWYRERIVALRAMEKHFHVPGEEFENLGQQECCGHCGGVRVLV